MHCHRILSIFVALFLFISLAACLVGAWSRYWWHGQFEAIIPIYNVTNVTDGYRMHWLFAMNCGLTKVCWRALQPRLTSDSDDYEIVKPLSQCFTEIPEEFSTHSNVQEEMIHFRNILICMIVAIIFNMLAFIFAWFKLPCVRRCKKPLIFLTIVMAIIAAIAVLVALFIANEMLYYEAPFMDTLLSKPPFYGENVTQLAKDLLYDVFARVRNTNLSDEFSKGYSFVVACIAEVFLLLAVIFTIFENCCLNRALDNEYLIEREEREKYAH